MTYGEWFPSPTLGSSYLTQRTKLVKILTHTSAPLPRYTLSRPLPVEHRGHTHIGNESLDSVFKIKQQCPFPLHTCPVSVLGFFHQQLFCSAFPPKISTRTHWTELKRREIPSIVLAGFSPVHFTPFGVVVLWCFCVLLCLCVHQLSVIVCHRLSSLVWSAKPNAKLMLHPLVSSCQPALVTLWNYSLGISSLLAGGNYALSSSFLHTLPSRALCRFFLLRAAFPTQRHGWRVCVLRGEIIP